MKKELEKIMKVEINIKTAMKIGHRKYILNLRSLVDKT